MTSLSLLPLLLWVAILHAIATATASIVSVFRPFPLARLSDTGAFLDRLLAAVDIHDNVSGHPYAALLLTGADLEAEATLCEAIVRQARAESRPVLLLQSTPTQTAQLADWLGLPLVHSGGMDSAVWLVDSVVDASGSQHFRMVHLPAGAAHPSPPTDCRVLDRDPQAGTSVIAEIVEYLRVCGGPSVSFDSSSADACWRLIHADVSTGAHRQRLVMQEQAETAATLAATMIPDSGAVWRELIETTFRFWEANWPRPFPFDKKQTVAHRLNSYWYFYLQAPPFSQLYYAFMLVDGIHNPETQLASADAVGLYASNLELSLHAELPDGSADPENLFWVKSSPPTQNTQHTVGRGWESTDAYSLSMNLGFNGMVAHGDMTFNYTHTFTASYSESRDITDWSVVETTNPITSTGKWAYFQQWPVEMRSNDLSNYPVLWRNYYEQLAQPCRVKDVPHLSKYALTTHNSIVWAISPRLRRQNPDLGDSTSATMLLPIRFRMEFRPRLSAHICANYDGTFRLWQGWQEFTDMAWTVNVADLNNIQYVEAV